MLILVALLVKGILANPQGPGCGALLTNKIVESTIDVTSPINASFDENHALLNSTNAWCSLESNTLQYLMITLDKPANLSGFAIQGLSSSNQYLKEFKIFYQGADDSVQEYPNDTNPTFFRPRPSDGDEITSFSLKGTVMKVLKFLPFDWNERICLRVELYGCVRVDGNFTAWSEWSSCSNSCGNGISVRYRTCSNPEPANNGHDCIGDVINTRECAGIYCPEDGVYSDWSEWTTCSKTCDLGFQQRARRCDNPSPNYGGKPCEGQPMEVQVCKIADCPDVSATSGARRSADKGGDSDKYFISTLVLAALLALSIFVLVVVLHRVRSSNKRRSVTVNQSNKEREAGE